MASRDAVDELRVAFDVAAMDIDLVHEFLSEQSHWARGISRARLETAIEGSLCAAAFLGARQIGFARVVTDGATFAYLCDVFIVSDARGQGHSLRLLEAVLAHPRLAGLRRFMLATSTAAPLYERLGFSALARPEQFMEQFDLHAYESDDCV